MGGVLGAEPLWVETFTGLRMWWFERLLKVVRERCGNGSGGGRPWCLPLADRVLLVAVEKTDQRRYRHNRGRRGGRPPAFDRQIYRRRSIVERCFNRLKGFRGIATRYDKTATSYEAAVSLASFLLWARSV